MNRCGFDYRVVAMMAAFFAVRLSAGVAAAQSGGQRESEVSRLSGQMSSAESNPSTADQVIGRLDAAEGNFAKLASGGKVDKGSLIPIYHQLESMLDRMETTYAKKKDDCIAQIDSGGQCDYDQPEQLAMKAADPRSRARFTAANTLLHENAAPSKRPRKQTNDGVTMSKRR